VLALLHLSAAQCQQSDSLQAAQRQAIRLTAGSTAANNVNKIQTEPMSLIQTACN